MMKDYSVLTCSLYDRPSLDMAPGNMFSESPLARLTYIRTIFKVQQKVRSASFFNTFGEEAE